MTSVGTQGSRCRILAAGGVFVPTGSLPVEALEEIDSGQRNMSEQWIHKTDDTAICLALNMRVQHVFTCI